MRQKLRFAMLWLVALVLVAGLSGQETNLKNTSVAPLYTLPPDGTWVDYAFTFKDSKDREHQGIMRTSSVGRQKVEGLPHRWVEFKMAGKTIVTRYGKMLVSEQAIIDREPLAEHVSQAFHKEGDNGAVTRFLGQRLVGYFTMGISGKLKQIKQETIETKLGKLKVVRVEAPGKMGDRALTYRAWLSDDVPFGLAKFEILETKGNQPERRVFEAEAAAKGTDAKSEVDHTTSK